MTTTNDHLLINKATGATLSKVVKLDSIDSAILAQVTGTGNVSATLKVYGGIYNEADGTWAIRVQDFSEVITGTGTALLKKNIKTVSTHVQFEVTGVSGTVTAALINTV